VGSPKRGGTNLNRLVREGSLIIHMIFKSVSGVRENSFDTIRKGLQGRGERKKVKGNKDFTLTFPGLGEA